MIDYSNLYKAIVLSDGVSAPARLAHADFYAKTLTREDLVADMEGVNSSIETIRKTRGGSWPSAPVERDFDLLDLAWHEREFREASSYAYVLYSNEGEYLGCVYLYGLGIRTPLTDETIEYEVDASWWVTTKAYESGYYEKVYEALQKWLPEEFGFSKIMYSNKVIPE